MGEGYRNIKPEQLPEGVTFCAPHTKVGSKVVSFSFPEGKWGAAHRYLWDLKTKKAQISRYYNTPDEVSQERDEA
jgi:hypothetical protein